MKVTYFGGPKDGLEENINPSNEYYLRQPVPIIKTLSEEEKKTRQLPDNPEEVLGFTYYNLDVKNSKYVWGGLSRWPLT